MFYVFLGARGSQNDEVDGYLNFDTIFSKNTPAYDIEQIMTCPVWTQLQSFMKVGNMVERVQRLRRESTVNCDREKYNNKTINCQKSSCLFNVIEDPCEQINIAERFPFLTKHIERVLSNIRLSKYPEDPLIGDPNANPDLFNGTWGVWTS